MLAQRDAKAAKFKKSLLLCVLGVPLREILVSFPFLVSWLPDYFVFI